MKGGLITHLHSIHNTTAEQDIKIKEQLQFSTIKIDIRNKKSYKQLILNEKYNKLREMLRSKGVLQQYEKLHTVVDFVVCKLCSKQFTTCGGLFRHLNETHHVIYKNHNDLRKDFNLLNIITLTSILRQINRQKTCLIKYGFNVASKSSISIEHGKQTFLRKYNVKGVLSKNSPFLPQIQTTNVAKL
jgi:hypothetical protein